ncbi:hypothetical protein DCC81_14520 [Chitinophaga parva]|uniref:Cthe-2314-like HEPN domain-containing protein n=1 Tax=Chitinophaga parva TaxID=2169414 RepID=A0A2T7BGT9_9BACT|nr:hypothetical protein [Chitinophaga parva]PUZ25495.1 hypothetical protein DCC81_14520 [Chitinophaga parva]
MDRHMDFILSPITEILKDAVAASTGIGVGIEAFPLTEYVMQSTFLKMTGFHEQKMKCICWELATDDYEYRYDLTRKAMGEFSSYNEKLKVYKDLLSQIKKYTSFTVATEIGRSELLRTSREEIEVIFKGTVLLSWTQEAFEQYENLVSIYQDNHFATDDGTLLASTSSPIYSLQTVYQDHLYKHRNRCAHNLLSYQENLPSLKTLLDKNYHYNNYYLWFMLLNLMDKIYRKLYNKYQEAFEDR